MDISKDKELLDFLEQISSADPEDVERLVDAEIEKYWTKRVEESIGAKKELAQRLSDILTKKPH